MSTSSDKPGMFAASGSSSTQTRGRSLPPPDDRLAEPETRYEVIEGERIYVSPADEPHATTHLALGYLLYAHVAPGYRGAADMLTRTSETSDFAPDASIYPAERDPHTGGRRLEELAFEIASTQSDDPTIIGSATKKARGLAARGVRRVFCLWLRQSQVLEWDRDTDAWRVLAPDAAITDVCLIRPLAVAALLDAALHDDEVARALLAKHNPVLAAELAASEARGEARGEAKGRAEAVVRVLDARGLLVPDELRARILACTDIEQLDRWIVRAATIVSTGELTDSD